MPKVTVALITYNRIKYLKEAIEGVLQQTYKDFELIIMDNGSTEETYQFIKPYLNDKVKYYRNSINSRNIVNKIFDLFSSEYLIITHDDDIMMENLLENQVAILEKNQDISIIASNTMFIDENSAIIKNKSQNIKKDIIWSKNEFIKDSIINNLYIPCPKVMRMKMIFDKYNLRFNLNVGPATDLYLWYETNLLDFKMYFLHEPLYKYRIHNLQDSTVSRIEMEFSIYSPILEFLAKNELNDLIPIEKRRRHNILFDTIINSYYHHNINFKEMSMLISKLRSLGFLPSVHSLRSSIKFLIRSIKL